MPHKALSYVWQVTGVQHALLPTENDFAAPSIPALTLRGFSRWESLEILLGPEEHVPFLQHAVKHWRLKHPDSGELFSPDLPRDVFPEHADPVVDKWHKSCAEQLRKQASERDTAASRGTNGEAHESGFTYAHVRSPYANSSVPRDKSMDQEYTPRSVPHAHVPARSGGVRLRSPDRMKRDSPAVETVRRKSFTGQRPARDQEVNPNYPPYSPTYVDGPATRGSGRRHSQVKSRPPLEEEDITSEDEDEMDVRPKRRTHGGSPAGGRRFVPPSVPQPPSAVNPPAALRSHRSDMREEDRKHRVASSPRGSTRTKLTESVSNVAPVGVKMDRERERERDRDRERELPVRERPRGDSRRDSYEAGMSRSHRSREQITVLPTTRIVGRYSEESDSEGSSEEESSEDEAPRKRPVRPERERPQPQFREAMARRGSDRSLRDDDIPPDRRRDRGHRRQMIPSRGSSRGDEERRKPHPDWDPRDREIGREPPSNRGRDRKKWDRRSEEERGPSPAMGMGGRRYAEPPYT